MKILVLEEVYIGGVEYSVQLDKTAVLNDLIISSPFSLEKTGNKIQWILCGIDDTENKNVLSEILPDRRSDRLYKWFKWNI